MRTVEEIRNLRLLQLLSMPQFPSTTALARALDRSQAQVSQWKNRNQRHGGGVSSMDSASARYIEQKTGMPAGWMDNDPMHDVSSMGMTVARWLDEKLPEERRNRAFWLIHQMVFADEWPALSTSAPVVPRVPSPEPSSEPEPSGNP